MKVLAFNGSPRKKWNTATLLNKALEGATSQGATTEMIHLYDLNYKGCISCFACKTKGGKSFGKCPVQDDLAEIFQKVEQADALIFGSPIYWGRVSGEMVAFLDRLLFQYLGYGKSRRSYYPKKINTGFIYTGNATEDSLKKMGMDKPIEINEWSMKMIFGSSESLISYETCQFEDYSKVEADLVDVEARAKRRAEVFPIDCQKAFDMGVRLATKELIKSIIQNPLKYTERALRDIKRTHHNDERLRQILLNPKKVDICGENTFIVRGRKTAKMKVEIIEGKYLLVHWFEYNKTFII